MQEFVKSEKFSLCPCCAWLSKELFDGANKWRMCQTQNKLRIVLSHRIMQCPIGFCCFLWQIVINQSRHVNYVDYRQMMWMATTIKQMECDLWWNGNGESIDAHVQISCNQSYDEDMSICVTVTLWHLHRHCHPSVTGYSDILHCQGIEQYLFSATVASATTTKLDCNYHR